MSMSRGLEGRVVTFLENSQHTEQESFVWPNNLHANNFRFPTAASSLSAKKPAEQGRGIDSLVTVSPAFARDEWTRGKSESLLSIALPEVCFLHSYLCSVLLSSRRDGCSSNFAACKNGKRARERAWSMEQSTARHRVVTSSSAYHSARWRALYYLESPSTPIAIA